MLRVDHRARHALFDVDATRRIEVLAQAALPPHTLMQRAGVAVARLALAIAPHSRHVWIACGPGNNGGDGLEAAVHLQRSGKSVVLTLLGNPEMAPPDAAVSYRRALEAGVPISESPPPDFDLGIDAMLGIGGSRAPEGRMAEWIRLMNAGSATLLAVDAPTGLQADTGTVAQPHIEASHTLALLTLKPGLFTAHGRDAAGAVWLDDLAVSAAICAQQQHIEPAAWLAGAPTVTQRLHASHKGSYGDVAVIGGAPGMTGAALLAASAALHAGAGRVFVGLIDQPSMSVDPSQTELMFRPLEAIDFKTMTVVCGCGGGQAIGEPLARILSTSARLVIDADALNGIAIDSKLQALLRARTRRLPATVLTPHPLEAARLLDCTAADVQGDRMAAARLMAQRFHCTVVLKGSGTIIAAPGQTPVVNSTGNARLATAGTGDVLAGMIGAALATRIAPFEAACEAVYRHGLIADQWPLDARPLTAGMLSKLR
ncbi:MAG: NAD(P)H-hydrate dehydratase [Rhodoferax sp.]